MIGTIEEQIRLEERTKEESIQRYLNELSVAISQDRFSGTKEGIFLLKTSLDTYTRALDEFLADTTRGQLEQDKKLLRLMFKKHSSLALLATTSIINLVSNGNQATLATVAQHIVAELGRVALHDSIAIDNPKFISYLGTEFKRANKRRKEQLILKHIKDLKNFDVYSKDKKVAIRIGVMLIDVLVNSGANIIEKASVWNGKHYAYVVRLTEDAKDAILKIGRSSLNGIMSVATRLPMIVKPVDYDNETLKGGYYKYPISLMKVTHNEHKKFIKGKDFSKVIPIVNKLQSVPWRFNKRVVDVISDIFESNMIDHSNKSLVPYLLGGLPTSDAYEVKNLLKKENFGVLKDGWQLGREEYHLYTRAKNEILIVLDREQGKRLSLMFALNVFTKMCDYDAIYFPHQLDYRGRVYPHTAFVSVQQPSYIKAMLEFANGEVLNDTGLKWLKIHIANCFGKDKITFEERIKFIDSIMDKIISTSKDPIEELYWWTQADSPFEFLAGCFAYSDYLKGLPIHLPIQLDSTCSGIQVYSGLLFDKEGAEAVNVINTYEEDSKCNKIN